MRCNPARFRAQPCFLALLLLLLGAAAGYGQMAHEADEIGQTVLWTQTVRNGWRVGVGRRVLPRLEVGFSTSAGDLFEPEIRWHLIENLPVIRLAIAATPGWIGFRTQFRLGPVHAAMGRQWGVDPLRWFSMAVAGNRSLALSVGWRSPGGLCAEAVVRGVTTRRWEVAFFFRDGAVGLGMATWD